MNAKLSSSLLCIATLALSGCAAKNFVHNYKGQQEFQRDKYNCQAEATQYAANFGAAGNPLIIADQMESCLVNKYGWRLAASE
ncbi:hypothetical protein [Alteromonas sp. P256]|uniref:hypothetical protein n=1 Tax=Alteromonas sp. P256 TaxID=3117399 RepID=UPI002FE0E572